MQALKFKATVKNGMIRIPERYQDQIPDQVRVIIFPERRSPGDDFIADLLAHPLYRPGFRPLKREEIHDRSF